jgi:hypothetical protein
MKKIHRGLKRVKSNCNSYDVGEREKDIMICRKHTDP